MLPMRKKIQQLINKGKVMAFIRGSIEFPGCTESKSLIKILKNDEYVYEDKDDLSYFDLN